ncbi:hypothetical protein ACFO25_04450 [Paenactinomyces guangxiensis]|uniref:Uncharacterized protein n=1 Tax=Paenactinomyces guangxiensis TaxID=1490290 RepID=A0A7W1WPC8_9BACL|nr:hypothetical protein [Paenactinomyces guangxiensis]MBA4493628.1 hypothetical protein [Paenactinomyces guangxiensis]MBH8590915.1 hypothetical protein [Paenactinomyces guangxiensis]
MISWIPAPLQFMILERPVLNENIRIEENSFIPALLFFGIMFFLGLFIQDRFLAKKEE